MLILTRRVGETLMVGDDVTVTVLVSKGTRCASASTRRRKSPYTGRKFTSASRKRKIKSQTINFYLIFPLQTG